MELLTEERLDEKESAELNLLRDIRTIFEERNVPAIKTEDLVSALMLTESGWINWYGRGLAANDIAKLVAPYGVKSTTVKVDGDVARRYRRDHFVEAWQRYLDEVTEVTLR